MNKMGFNVKMDGDTILYIVLIVGLMFFVFNMSDIYQFVSKVKTGEIFQSNKPEPGKDDDKEEEPEEENYIVVTPVGKSYGVCSKSIADDSGDKTYTVKLYHTDNKLKSIVEELEYSGISDKYMNYIYSENNKYKQRQIRNKTLEGYSVVPTLSSSTTLKVSSVIDLSTTTLSKINLDEGEKLEIVGAYNQDTVELTDEYVNLGFECIW